MHVLGEVSGNLLMFLPPICQVWGALLHHIRQLECMLSVIISVMQNADLTSLTFNLHTPLSRLVNFYCGIISVSSMQLAKNTNIKSRLQIYWLYHSFLMLISFLAYINTVSQYYYVISHYKLCSFIFVNQM